MDDRNLTSATETNNDDRNYKLTYDDSANGWRNVMHTNA